MLGTKYGCEAEWPRPRHKAESRAGAVTETVGFRINKAIELID